MCVVNTRYRLGLRPLLAALFLVAAAGRVYSQWVEDSISVPGAWVGSLCYNPSADVIYGTSEEANAVFAISCVSNIMFRRLSAHDARFIVYDSIDNKAFVSCGWEGAESVCVVDGRNHILLGGFSVPGASRLVWEATRNRLYVTCTSENCVAVVDCAGDSVIGQIAVGIGPGVLHLNTRRDKLYVQNYDDASLSIIDLATNQVIKTIQLGGYPNAGYYARHVDKYYCASDRGDAAIVIIDGLADSAVARIPIMVHGYVHAVGGSDATDVVLAQASNGPNALYAIDAREDTLMSTLDVSGPIYSIVCGPATGFLYCANEGSDSIVVVDPGGTMVVSAFPVGDAPFVLLPVPRHGRMYLGHLGGDKVYVIRDSSTGVAEGGALNRLEPFGLVASPNPFTVSTTLALVSAETPGAAVVIFSSDGREVRTLEPARDVRRKHGIIWDGADETGSPAPIGVYVAQQIGRPGGGTKLVKVR